MTFFKDDCLITNVKYIDNYMSKFVFAHTNIKLSRQEFV